MQGVPTHQVLPGHFHRKHSSVHMIFQLLDGAFGACSVPNSRKVVNTINRLQCAFKFIEDLLV